MLRVLTLKGGVFNNGKINFEYLGLFPKYIYSISLILGRVNIILGFTYWGVNVIVIVNIYL